MGRIRRKFSDEFKLSLASEIRAGKITISEAARKHQLSTGLVSLWLQKFDQGGTPNAAVNKPSVRERDLERENALLKEKVAELFLQVDLLKKAESWMAQRKSVSSSVITKSNLGRYKKGAK